MTRRMTRTVTRVTRVVDVLAPILALFAPMPHTPAHREAATSDGAPVRAVLVECWEDLACSDGSTLDRWDCARPSFVDDRGRLVHSNGQCTGTARDPGKEG